MTVLQVIFYVLAAVAIFSGLMVVVARNAMHGVLFLVLAFFASAGIWLLLNAEFLALILVLVYVGAVMTLFLFVIMMLSMRVVSRSEGFVRYLPFAALLVLTIAAMTVAVIHIAQPDLTMMPEMKSADYSNVANLGAVLYTDYALPFEIAAVLLLTSIVAAIALTHRRPHGTKTQNSAAQIAVRREDRVRLVKMKSEKKNK